jgi:isopenicillin N synthase-like dioxygenase
VIDAMMNVSREFFGKPAKEKQKYTSLMNGERFRLEGYRNELVKSDGQTLNWSHCLSLQIEPEDARSLHLWPNHPETFRQVIWFLAPET